MKNLAIFLLLWLLAPLGALAQSNDDVISAELRPGWRMADGTHMAALHMRLAPGWKTYWRAPGDAGIPPEFSWSGAQNIRAVEVMWPTPTVFWQSGMRSIGYGGEVVLPLRISLSQPGQAARLGGTVDIGICKEICIPHRVRVQTALPLQAKRPDPVIAGALADLPLSGAEAGIGTVTCRITPTTGGLIVESEIQTSGTWDTVIEARDPEIWVAEPKTSRSGGALHAQTVMRHASGGAFALSRSDLRFTLLGPQGAVDLRGCKGS